MWRACSDMEGHFQLCGEYKVMWKDIIGKRWRDILKQDGGWGVRWKNIRSNMNGF